LASISSIAAARRGVSSTASEPAASPASSNSASGTRPASSSRPVHTSRAVWTKSKSAYCASTDQRSRCRRSSTSLRTAADTATTIKLATRLVKSAWRDQNPSLTKSQTTAPESTSTLRPPMIRVERTYVRSESERRGPTVRRAISRRAYCGALNELSLMGLVVELARVEVVPPGFDLAVVDLEGSHDPQVERLAGKREDVDPLRHHDWTVGGDVDDAELNAFNAGRAGTDERGEVVGNVSSASDRLERDVVVDGVGGEERG